MSSIVQETTCTHMIFIGIYSKLGNFHASKFWTLQFSAHLILVKKKDEIRRTKNLLRTGCYCPCWFVTCRGNVTSRKMDREQLDLETAAFTKWLCISGYHIYKDLWEVAIGEKLV